MHIKILSGAVEGKFCSLVLFDPLPPDMLITPFGALWEHHNETWTVGSVPACGQPRQLQAIDHAAFKVLQFHLQQHCGMRKLLTLLLLGEQIIAR